MAGIVFSPLQTGNLAPYLHGVVTTSVVAVNAAASAHEIPPAVNATVEVFEQTTGTITLGIGDSSGAAIPLDATGYGSLTVVLSNRESLTNAWTSVTNVLSVSHTDSLLTTTFPTSFTTRPGAFSIDLRSP